MAEQGVRREKRNRKVKKVTFISDSAKHIQAICHKHKQLCRIDEHDTDVSTVVLDSTTRNRSIKKEGR